MSVYTELSREDLETFLSQFDLGELVEFQGVTEGIENTNYRIQCQQGGEYRWYFLTLVEYGPDHPLIDFVTLCSHYADYGSAVPAPIPDRAGVQLHELKDKPAILVPCVPGHHLQRHQLTEDHLYQLGKTIGHMHLAAMSFPNTIHNSKGLVWWQRKAAQFIETLPEHQKQLLQKEIEFQGDQYETYQDIPRAIVHGDLFLDNVLFNDDKISGVIDFYNSAYDHLMFDLAVVANDWCINADLKLIPNKVDALLKGYETERTITDAEHQAWPNFLRGAALRFWLSRLDTQAFQAESEGNFVGKDPDVMANMLLLRVNGE